MKMAGKKDQITKNEITPVAEEPSGFSWHTCKNCNYHFEGKFCPACGQSVKEVQQPLGHFIKDLAGSLFSFDLRLFKSLPVLAFRPGALSDEYIAGKRKTYVAPFRLFFFMSVVLFFLISWQTQKKVDQIWKDPEFNLKADSSEQIMGRVAGSIGDQDTIVALTSLRDGLGLVQLMQASLQEQLEDSTLTQGERLEKELKLASTKNPDYIISKFFQYLSWSFFVLMPLFALLLFMFFFKQRRYYVEHLIFSINLHSFYFLIMILLVLMTMIFQNALSKLGFWIFLIMIAYSIIGIKSFYKKRWFSAIVYSFAIFALYFIFSIALLVGGIVIASQFF
jgi:hypothetical protein